MYLTSIKLAGFKSFVDPTKIPVRSHMTAIVGPNGCGKSNIVDAIRWVIGESSAKQLRGQLMSDVIFNGTTERKPVGRAMVELHFDNSSGRIRGEYAKYTDLVIRREVERDGQSSYFLNGASCRRRDILDIFLGTGLGPRSYSIIEQGMISQLIEAKPDELRAHFEEVAGISKYKERRRETQTRIQHTQDNLDRLNDIREELDKQLRHLNRQAQAAEQYQVLKQEERTLSAQMKALQWQALEQKRLAQQEKRNQQELLREQKIAEQRQYEVELDKIRIDQETLEEKQQSIQRRYYQIGEAMARLEQQIKHYHEQTERWRAEYADTATLWEELSETSLEHREQITELEALLSTLSPQQGSAHSELVQAQTGLAKANVAMQGWQGRWDHYQQAASENNSQLQVTQAKIESHEQQLLQLKDRRQKGEARLSQMQLVGLEKEIQPLHAELDKAQEQVTASQNDLEAYQQKILEQRVANKEHQQSVQTKQQQLQALEAEQAKIAALQQAALGCHDEKSIHWLSQQGLQHQARLGQVLQVESGWEQAVEMVLSGYFDAVCVDSIDHYTEPLAQLLEGRITLVDRPKAGVLPNALGRVSLMSKVQSEWALDALHGVFVAETLKEAEAMRATLEAHESVVTREGLWLGPHWVRVSHWVEASQGILEREKTLQQLSEDIQGVKAARGAQEQLLKQAEADLVLLEQSRDALQKAYQNHSAALSTARASFSVKSAQLDNAREEEARLQAELADIHQRLLGTQQQLAQLAEQSQQLESSLTGLQNTRPMLLNEKEVCQEALDAARRFAQQQQQQTDELSIRLSANESQLGLLRQTLLRSEKQLAQLEERRQFLSEHLSENDSPMETFETELQEKLSQRLLVERDLKTAEASVVALRRRSKELEGAKHAVLESLNQIGSVLDKVRLQEQEASVRQQTISEQLLEVSLTLEPIVAALPEEAEIGEWELRLSELSQKIMHLGPINLAAIEEHQTSCERKEYLDKQFQDLTESLSTLEAAIRKMDQESRTRFRDTFDKVNQGFQSIFPRIFGGGRATLALLEEEDLLTAGIVVKAQPPGKKNSTIHLLSGGEKALTAIALIFAMFQLNPAPFCILDEVDAPLDDLNVGRFCALVKEMSKETQFLMISHNKVTIESADHLMGVTMQEAGVSRLVSVDVAEALEMVELA